MEPRKSRAELLQLKLPELRDYAKRIGITGYSGLNKEPLIDYILNPPPKEAQKSPGRPKGTGGAKVAPPSIIPAPIGVPLIPVPVPISQIPIQPTPISQIPIQPNLVPSTLPAPMAVPSAEETRSWTDQNLKSLDLKTLKAILVKLGISGYSGKNKETVLGALIANPPKTNITIELPNGKRITFMGGAAPSVPSFIPTASILPMPLIPSVVPLAVPSAPSISPIAPVQPIKISPRQPAPILTPVTRNLVELPIPDVNTVTAILDINDVNYEVRQPLRGDIVYLRGYPKSQQSYAVTEVQRDASGSYIEYVTLHPIVKVDGAKHMVFVDLSGAPLRAMLEVSAVPPSWKLLSGEPVEFMWGYSSV